MLIFIFYVVDINLEVSQKRWLIDQFYNSFTSFFYFNSSCGYSNSRWATLFHPLTQKNRAKRQSNLLVARRMQRLPKITLAVPPKPARMTLLILSTNKNQSNPAKAAKLEIKILPPKTRSELRPRALLKTTLVTRSESSTKLTTKASQSEQLAMPLSRHSF